MSRNSPNGSDTPSRTERAARAKVHSNIALIKYWGKRPGDGNFPAVPSLSLTLDALSTVTEVRFDPGYSADELWLDGHHVEGRPLERAVRMLDRLRERAGSVYRARIITHNDFPTAAGLASSASGFVELATAASAALGLGLDAGELSAVSRESSASAARSIFGGYVELTVGAPSAAPLAPGDAFPLTMLIAVTKRGEKAIGSTEAMQATRATSPYYDSWVESAPALFERARRAVLEQDFDTLGQAMEHSTLLMHACMLSAWPAISYMAPASVAVADRVRSLRNQGLPCYFTMDAGPHVKVLTPPEHARDLNSELQGLEGVHELIECRPGPGASILDDSATTTADEAASPTA